MAHLPLRKILTYISDKSPFSSILKTNVVMSLSYFGEKGLKIR